MSHKEDTDLNNYSILYSTYFLKDHVSCEAPSSLPSLRGRKKTALVGRRGQGSQDKEQQTTERVCVCVCVCMCAHVCKHACKNACVFMPVSDTCKKESKISILRTTNAMGHRWTWHH